MQYDVGLGSVIRGYNLGRAGVDGGLINPPLIVKYIFSMSKCQGFD